MNAAFPLLGPQHVLVAAEVDVFLALQADTAARENRLHKKRRSEQRRQMKSVYLLTIKFRTSAGFNGLPRSRSSRQFSSPPQG
jgi:hypothetical protein